MLNKQRALEVIEFVQTLHLTGDFYGQMMVLQDWQHDIIWNVYGTVTKRGYRQYRYAYLEIPKKNGKTTLIAALALYHLSMDPAGGEIYCCAADKKQAGLTYNAIKQMVEQEPELQDILNIVDSKKEIINTITGTTLSVLSAEVFTKHGLNPTVVIFDELHAQPNRDLWDVMTFGAGAARNEPLWWIITTAGDDPDRKSVGWEQHEYSRRVIDGELTDPTRYAKIYGAPEEADIWDEELWYKVNPSLGVTINIETVRQEALTAKNSPSVEKLFRWLRLNQWVSFKKTGWLPLSLWDATNATWGLDEMVGKRCYIGLDLSSTTDLTAAALLFPPQQGFENEWRCLFETWVPDENMKERVLRDHVPYDVWVNSKHLIATPGDVVDYEYVQSRLEALAKLYKVRFLCVDKWNATMLTQNLAKKGIKSISIEQTVAGLSPGMKEFERLLRETQLTHEQNPLVRWAFGNVVVYIDGNGNMKPMKNRSMEKIDPMVALISAMNAAFRLENKKSSYEEHGIRSV